MPKSIHAFWIPTHERAHRLTLSLGGEYHGSTFIFGRIPKGEFAAFSTAKMTHFLPYSHDTNTKDLKGFFGDNFQYLTKTPIGRLKIEIPNTEPLIVQYGEIIARFANGKFKVIDSTYFHKNFNDPLVDEDEKGIY